MVGKVLESDPGEELIVRVEEHTRALHLGDASKAWRSGHPFGQHEVGDAGPLNHRPPDSFHVHESGHRSLFVESTSSSSTSTRGFHHEHSIWARKQRLKALHEHGADDNTNSPRAKEKGRGSGMLGSEHNGFSSWREMDLWKSKGGDSAAGARPPPVVVGFDAPSSTGSSQGSPNGLLQETTDSSPGSQWCLRPLGELRPKASSPLSHMLAQAQNALHAVEEVEPPSCSSFGSFCEMAAPELLQQASSSAWQINSPASSPLAIPPVSRVSPDYSRSHAHTPYSSTWNEAPVVRRRLSAGSSTLKPQDAAGMSDRWQHLTPPPHSPPHQRTYAPLSSSPLGPRRFSLSAVPTYNHSKTPPNLPTGHRHQSHEQQPEARSAPTDGSWASGRPGSAPSQGQGRVLMRAWRRSLVGSFQECLLSGRLPVATSSHQHLEGFLAVLSVAGGDWSPPQRRLPFSVACVDASTALYSASVDLSGTQRRHSESSASSPPAPSADPARSRYRVPHKGKLQLVLSNPERTPVHTFVCTYDLSDMEAGQKTYVRQKVYASESNASAKKGSNPGMLLYAVHAHFMCIASRGRKSYPAASSDGRAVEGVDGVVSSRRCYLYGDLRVVFPQRRSDADNVQLRVEYEHPENPRYFDL